MKPYEAYLCVQLSRVCGCGTKSACLAVQTRNIRQIVEVFDDVESEDTAHDHLPLADLQLIVNALLGVYRLNFVQQEKREERKLSRLLELLRCSASPEEVIFDPAKISEDGFDLFSLVFCDF